jgi:hypothetical protein
MSITKEQAYEEIKKQVLSKPGYSFVELRDNILVFKKDNNIYFNGFITEKPPTYTIVYYLQLDEKEGFSARSRRNRKRKKAKEALDKGSKCLHGLNHSRCEQFKPGDFAEAKSITFDESVEIDKSSNCLQSKQFEHSEFLKGKSIGSDKSIEIDKYIYDLTGFTKIEDFNKK